MFATLPDFTPRDSHSLWYSSSRGPVPNPQIHHDQHHPHHHPNDPNQPHHNNSNNNHYRHRPQHLERSTLHRLARDEFHLTGRKVNVANFGAYWLRPPGMPKTLHQLREEKRELDEHQEAMRREQLAQELAEAEAAGMPEDGMMDDVQLDGAQDLDDEIPDAGDDYFGGDDDDDDSEDLNDEDEVEELLDDHEIREERHVDLMTTRMRMTDDAFREALIRGDPDGDNMYGGEEELEEEGQGHILDEDDFAQSSLAEGMGDMDADLDEDIPEAEDGGYEHTDSEAELLSSDSDASAGGYADEDDEDDDDDDGDMGDFAPRSSAQVMRPPQSPTLRAQGHAAASRHSLELSSILSQDESSFMDSSPMGRRAR